MILLNLPFPPSANALTRNVPGRGRVKTERYKTWLRAAGTEVLATPLDRRVPIMGPYSVVIILADARRWHKNGKRKKIDGPNFFKAPEDLMVAHQLLEDDHLAEHAAVTWSKTVPDCPMRCEEPKTTRPWSRSTDTSRPRTDLCSRTPGT